MGMCCQRLIARCVLSSILQLIEMSLEEMEMPGQHLPAPDAPDMVGAHVAGGRLQFSCKLHCRTTIAFVLLQVYVDRLGSNVQVVRRNSNSCRRIALHGSDGSLRTFLIQSSQVGDFLQFSWPLPLLLPRT